MLFSDEGLRRIAERAADEQTGARGLMTVCERVLRPLKFELPTTPGKRFVVTKRLVENPTAELKTLPAEHKADEAVVARQLVQDFAQSLVTFGFGIWLHAARNGTKLFFSSISSGHNPLFF